MKDLVSKEAGFHVGREVKQKSGIERVDEGQITTEKGFITFVLSIRSPSERRAISLLKLKWLQF